MQVLAIDLLYYLPSLKEPLLSAVLLFCALPDSSHLVVHIVEVLNSRLQEHSDELQAVIDFSIKLLSQSQRVLQTPQDLEIFKTVATGLAKASGKRPLPLAYIYSEGSQDLQ